MGGGIGEVGQCENVRGKAKLLEKGCKTWFGVRCCVLGVVMPRRDKGVASVG